MLSYAGSFHDSRAGRETKNTQARGVYCYARRRASFRTGSNTGHLLFWTVSYRRCRRWKSPIYLRCSPAIYLWRGRTQYRCSPCSAAKRSSSCAEDHDAGARDEVLRCWSRGPDALSGPLKNIRSQIAPGGAQDFLSVLQPPVGYLGDPLLPANESRAVHTEPACGLIKRESGLFAILRDGFLVLHSLLVAESATNVKPQSCTFCRRPVFSLVVDCAT